MTESTSALTHARPVSLEKAMSDCFSACNLTDVLLACACLDALLARRRSENENDADICDGVAALIRFTAESMYRREKASFKALQTLSGAIQRERAQSTT